MLTDPDPQSILCASGGTLGNRFCLITLLRKRARSLVDGSPPLIETESRNPVSVALQEIHRGKVRMGTPGQPRPNQAESNDPLSFQSKALAYVLGLYDGDGEDLSNIGDS